MLLLVLPLLLLLVRPRRRPNNPISGTPMLLPCGHRHPSASPAESHWLDRLPCRLLHAPRFPSPVPSIRCSLPFPEPTGDFSCPGLLARPLKAPSPALPETPKTRCLASHASAETRVGHRRVLTAEATRPPSTECFGQPFWSLREPPHKEKKKRTIADAASPSKGCIITNTRLPSSIFSKAYQTRSSRVTGSS